MGPNWPTQSAAQDIRLVVGERESLSSEWYKVGGNEQLPPARKKAGLEADMWRG